MKSKKISIKWKTFLIFLIFTIVLLGVLWFFQIVYLDDFYKTIKTQETENVLDQVEETLLSCEDCTEDIENIAASHNLGILITNSEGGSLYNAEYISNSKMSSIPPHMFRYFYEQAKENDGEAVIEFKGNEMQKIPLELLFKTEELLEQESAQSGKIPYTVPKDDRPSDFHQNIGNDMAESVIYVRIIDNAGTEQVIMINSVLTPVDATVDTLKAQMKYITLIIIIVAFILAVALSRTISKSIIKINDGAKQLAAGDYSVKFDSHDYMEVAELSDTLNYTATELGKADSFQKELIANVSHDLRTPLTMIKGYAEVMRDIPGENTPENVQVIIDETERLSGLVNDMLDISKLKAGTITLQPAQYNITESIRHVLERYNKLREVDGYTIDFIYDDEISVYADEQKMYQVIYNLVNNAINYTGDDKKVTVTQKVTDDILRIEVSDTGEGVKQEDIPYVWDRYYKDSSVHKRAIQGTGLGLSIVKNILELHGAKYGVSSVTGKGATFWFELNL